MPKQFSCGDLMQGCQFVAKADNEQRLLQEVAKHAAQAHGITQITPDLLTKVKAAIKTAQ
jgi:predicted small metal-binding protein